MDFSTIEPLVEKEDFRNDTLYVTFTCRETNVSHQSSAYVEQSTAQKLMSGAGKTIQNQMFWSAKRTLSQLIGGALGYGMAGRMGRQLVGSVLDNVGRGGAGQSSRSLSKEARERAILQAFEKVSSYFTWNKSLKKWVGVKKELMVPFFAKLESAPIQDRYDKIILARMLTEIAASDGSIDEDEKEFLSDFLPDEAGPLDGLLKKEKLNKIELQETSKAASRETMILLTWGMAFCDEELSAEEKEKVQFFGDSLGLDSTKQQELKEMAAQYVIDQMFTSMYASGRFESGKAEVYALANKLDVSEELVQRTEVNFKKRNLLY